MNAVVVWTVTSLVLGVSLLLVKSRLSPFVNYGVILKTETIPFHIVIKTPDSCEVSILKLRIHVYLLNYLILFIFAHYV